VVFAIVVVISHTLLVVTYKTYIFNIFTNWQTV